MPVWRGVVIIADGDFWGRERVMCEVEVEVEAESEIDARLAIEQLALTPHQGKPDHPQIVSTTLRIP